MSTVKLLCSAFVLAATALLASCSGDCNKASDCAADEVCYQEICQKAYSSFYSQSCTRDEDCDFNGDGQSNLFCQLGRCRVKDNSMVVIPDSGNVDTGTPDTGMMDTGMMDTGMMDTGTSTTPDGG